MVDDITGGFSAIGLPPELATVAIALALLSKVVPAINFLFMWGRSGWRWTRGLPAVGKRRQQRQVRQNFADYIVSRIEDVNQQERWTNDRYADLEAEIEMNLDDALTLPWIKKIPVQRHKVRRTTGLSRALERSPARLIMLVGGPGSGKSVALRNLACRLARRAVRSASVNTTIPIYVNLRHLEQGDAEIGADLIEGFVVKSLGGDDPNSSVREFLEQQFKPKLGDESWLFLFDSFDEIPEILRSTENDSVVEDYSKAIESFMHLRNSRCVVASRDFRRPEKLHSQNWTIAPLSERKKRALLKKADTGPNGRKRLKEWLPEAPDDITLLCSTPLFLSLVCAYVRDNTGVPKDAQEVFDSFVTRRLKTERPTSDSGVPLTATDVRAVAERIGFAMAAVDGLGLSPSRSRLMSALATVTNAERTVVDGAMQALQNARLARGGGHGGEEDPSFEFVHRRFAEYFATEVVRHRRELLEASGLEESLARRLLLDGRWRETAVTLCQLGDEGAGPFLREAEAFLLDAARPYPALDETRLESIERGEITDEGTDFVWPNGLHHVLSVLQSGFPDREGLTRPLQVSAGNCLVAAYESGSSYDRYWAVEVAGIAQDAAFTGLLRAAFQGRFEIVKESAYRQVARLATVPDDIAETIRAHLVRMAIDGSLRADPLTVKAQLMRLSRRRHFLSALSLLRIAWWVDLAAHVFVLLWLIRMTDGEPNMLLWNTVVLVILFASWSAPTVLTGITPGLLLALRAGVVWGLATFVLFDRAGPEGSGAWGAWSLIALTWSPAALVAVRQGRMLRWPLPLFVHVALLPAGWAFLRGANKVLLTTVPLMAGLIAAGTLIGPPSLSWVPDWVGLGLGVLFVGAVAVTIVAGFGTYLWELWQDRVWYEEWRASQRGNATVVVFLDWLASQRTAGGAIRLVAATRSDGLLKEDDDAPEVLSDLERATGAAVAASDIKQPIMMVRRSGGFADWFDDEREKRQKQLQGFGRPFLDELARLVVDLRGRPAATDTWADEPPAAAAVGSTSVS